MLVRMLIVLCVAFMISPAQAAEYTVNCDAPAPGIFAEIQHALDAIIAADEKIGPNTINVTGTCDFNLSLTGFNNLTIQGSGGAAIVRAACGESGGAGSGSPLVSLTDSRNITIAGFLLRGAQGVRLQDSSLTLIAVTVEGSRATGIEVNGGSSLNLNAQTEDVKNIVRTSCGNGIFVGQGSNAGMGRWVDIVDNGNNGVVASAGFVNLNAGSDSLVHVSGNRFGLFANDGGVISVNGGGATSALVIENNDIFGIEVANNSAVNLNGNVVVQNNFMAPPPEALFALAHPSGIFVHNNSVLNVGRPVVIQNNDGAGISGHLGAVIMLGGPGGSEAPSGPTIRTNDVGGVVLTGMSIAEFNPTSASTGNVGSDASCDATSAVIGTTTGIGNIKCSSVDKGK